MGRLIRSETDTGTALLLDFRYRDEAVRELLPWERPFLPFPED